MMKIATIALFVLYPDGTPDSRKALFDARLHLAFTDELEDAWWGIDCGSMPTAMIFDSCCMNVEAEDYSDGGGPGEVETYDLGNGWVVIGNLHETTVGIRDATQEAKPQWQITVNDGGTIYYAPVHAYFRIGDTKSFT